MQNLWNDAEAAQFEGPLGPRVYTSRLLGRDAALVLHGGGNTSVKLRERNLVGDDEEILYVKGSGWDLAAIQAGGFAPVRLAPMLRLAELESLSDPQMVNELQTQVTRAGAPTPSVETILHAVLPYRYVDHTHADAVVTVTNTPGGEQRIREIYGDRVVVIPYVMPGFDLAREVARRFPRESGPNTVGMVLLNHGIFSFGETARESYQRMIELVGMAEAYLEMQGTRLPSPQPVPQGGRSDRVEIARLRAEISRAAGVPMILSVTGSALGVEFAARPDLADIARRGPATPDHVIRTKPLPMVGGDVAAFGEEYKAYFAEHESKARERKTMLDTAPRVVLDAGLGLCCAGRTAADAAIVADIYEHTMECILRAEKLGGWQALPMHHLFDMEYWDLEQAKLRKGGKAPMFQGEVALITGAASGIGRACAESFLQRGAAVIGLDLNPAVVDTLKHPAWLGIPCDVSDESALASALETGVRRFGGLDMLVLNAGLFPGGKPVSQLSGEEWRKVMAVNLDANLSLLREAHPLLKLAPGKGRVVIIGSKNVPAPGPGAAAYSASKAALTQLMRVVALEWGGDGIRLNALHPNAVFDTGIWTEEVLNARARHYGVTVEQYKTNNVLKVEVTSRDVAELAAEMCGPLFAKTTAAQVPVDGGNERVI